MECCLVSYFPMKKREVNKVARLIARKNILQIGEKYCASC